MNNLSGSPSPNEVTISYLLDAFGEPVRDQEYGRLARLLNEGWVLRKLKEANLPEGHVYSVTLECPTVSVNEPPSRRTPED
ncbi:hypothetical protein [Zavarzinella formosa]|uniref:hypothetical protein n=1 Tax=Zavarzinella formosa TaxID=360055 RepID=UPI0002D3D243|nr:hypothetical protein [Zavarzinella formosa]